MARIDRQRLDRADFPVVIEIPTRFADLDVQFHVNNVAAVSILQEARSRFNMAMGLRDLLAGRRLLVAGLTVEYAGEMHHPGMIEIGTGILAMGRSAVTIGQRAVQDGTPRLYAESVMVIAGDAGPEPIPDAAREAYAALTIA